MPRYALKIEYDGAPFRGWQCQDGQPSVQQALEEALRALEPGAATVTGAGRTDTGVHALGQVAHCDLARAWDPFRLTEALNYHLKPAPVAILAAARVADDFHARFDAVKRRYLFRLVSRRAPVVIERGKVWQVRHSLALAPMRAAAAHLIGRHDFTTFRASQCQAQSPVKTLERLDIEELPYAQGREYRFHIEARSFLHNQVRSFVGTLERVGAGAVNAGAGAVNAGAGGVDASAGGVNTGGGTWTPERVRAALEARDRAACGPVCPPQGLYLAEVTYPQDPFA